MSTLWPAIEELTIRTVRVFPYAVDQVFEAWTDPELLKRWWGPHGFTNTFHVHNLKPGGEWRFIMHGPDGTDFVNACVFMVIEKNRFLAWDRLTAPLFQVQTSFFETGPKETRLEFRMVFSNTILRNKIARFAVEKNEENFDRLSEVLASMQ